MLKESADFVTEEPRGTGDASLVRQMIAERNVGRR
jgi:hypothetical protein